MPGRIDVSELRVFSEVVAQRGFSRAAMKLHKTQPAISQSIRRIETALGEKLFHRDTKEPVLTEAGRVLLGYTQKLIAISEEAENAVKDLKSLRRGRIRIGANEASVQLLLPLLARFRQAHPSVQLDVQRSRAREIGAQVAQGELDFGVLTFSPLEQGLRSIVLGQDELVMLVHASSPLRHHSEVSLTECANQALIAHNDPSYMRDRVLRVFEQRKIVTSLPMQLPSLEAIKRAVAMQLGAALLPRRCAESELERGELFALRLADVKFRTKVRLVYRVRGERSYAAAAFLRMLGDHKQPRTRTTD